jgi:glycosyltransferase domain-containing protein
MMNKLDFRDKLTLVIPTRNRSAYLHRLLSFCEGSFPPISIIVADSSDSEESRINLTCCSQASMHRLRRLEYASEVPVLAKMIDAVRNVETPFMALCADDDFLLPGCLPEAVHILDSDPSTSCVQGLEVFFRSGASIGKPDRLLLDLHAGGSVLDETPTARMVRALSNYRASFYAIRRTQEFLEDSTKLNPLKDQYMLLELASASLDAIRGKIKRLPRVMSFRESHPQVAYRTHSEVTYWEKVIFSPAFSEVLQAYISIVGGSLESFQKTGVGDTSAKVRESLVAFSIWHFRRMASASQTCEQKLPKKVREFVFEIPIVGGGARWIWLKLAKAYDMAKLSSRFGLALRHPDFLKLIECLEAEFGFRRGSAIIR